MPCVLLNPNVFDLTFLDLDAHARITSNDVKVGEYRNGLTLAFWVKVDDDEAAGFTRSIFMVFSNDQDPALQVDLDTTSGQSIIVSSQGFTGPSSL